MERVETTADRRCYLRMMIRGKILISCLTGSLVLGPFAGASPTRFPANPFRDIVRRNVFGLRPRLPSRNESPAPPAPQVVLTGITTILPKKLALLEVKLPPKPNQPPKEQSYILSEGQRAGQVKVLKIDEKAGSVDADVYGTVMHLTFDKNGPLLPQAPSPMVQLRRPFGFALRR